MTTMSLWDMTLKWMADATIWDWVWHILAALLVVVFSVPHIFWGWIKKWFGRNNNEPETR